MAYKKLALLTFFTLSSSMIWGTTRTWEGTGVNDDWSNINNWQNGVPVNGDSLSFIPGIVGEQTTSNNDISNLSLVNISLGLPSPNPSIDFTLTGNAVTMESSPALTFTNGTHTFNIPLVLSSNLTITESSSTATMGGDISESAAGSTITYSGISLTMGGTSSYSGGTAVVTGTLIYGADSNLGTGPVSLGTTTSGSPILQANIGFSTAEVISLVATNSCIDPNGHTLTHMHPGGVSGSGGLLIGQPSSPAGTELVVDTTYSHTGGTILVTGTLVLEAAGSLPAPGASPQGNLTLQGTSTVFNLAAATSPVTIGNLEGIGGSLVQMGSNNLVVTCSTFTTCDSSFSGTGGVLTKTGSATWDLQASSSYTGGTIVQQGILEVSAAGVIPTGPMTIDSGATFNISGAVSAQTIGDLSGSGILALGGNTLNYVQSSNVTTFGGTITSSSGLFNIDAPGLPTAYALQLTASSPSLFGPVTITQGTLEAEVANIFPNCGLVTIDSEGVFDLEGHSQTIGDLTGSGTVNFTSGEILSLGGDNGSHTWSGSITGPGQVVKQGSGTFTYGIAQSYTNGTTVTAGTLTTTVADAFPATGLMTIASGATLNTGGSDQIINQIAGAGRIVFAAAETLEVGADDSSSTFQGVISGNGTLIKQGTGILTLSGSNSYAGGTNVLGGTLKAGATETFSPTGTIGLNPGTTMALNGFTQVVGNISGAGSLITFSNGETLIVGDGNSTAFSGSIQGPGALEKTGIGTLTLDGHNTYTLGTTVLIGTLAITGGGNIPPTGPMDIIAGTFDISGAANPQTIGTLSGEGAIILGANTLTNNPTSNSFFFGTITGTAGSAFIQNQPYLLLETGDWVLGTLEIAQGTISIISPGSVTATVDVSSPGTLKGTGTVIGTINNSGTVAPGGSIGTLSVTGAYNESGTLSIEVNDKGQCSLLAIMGDMTINSGTTLMLSPDFGTYSTPLTYKVATITGTRTGTYSSVQTTLFNRYKAEVIYSPDPSILVTFITVPFASILPGVPASNCLDSIPQSTGSDGQLVINALDAISNDLSDLKKAVLQLQPNQYGALALAQENNDILIRSALTHRFSYHYSKARPPAASDQQTPRPSPKRGSVWFEPLGKYAHQQAQQQNHGYQAATGGALLGADYRLNRHIYLGGAAGYTFTDVKIKSSSGKADINSYYGALYSSWFTRRVFIDASMIASYNFYKAHRNIHFPGVHRQAQNTHGGYQLGGSLGTGVFFNPGSYQIAPYARADYIFLHQNSFTEHGAKSLDLKMKSTDSRYVRTDLGVKVSNFYRTPTLKVIPFVKVSWIWEKQLDEARFNASFIDTSCGFSVKGLHPVRSLFAPSIGVTTLAHHDTFSFGVYYDAEISQRFWENRAYINFSHRY
jgi:fibronectin-binding autotransporter adhesin